MNKITNGCCSGDHVTNGIIETTTPILKSTQILGLPQHHFGGTIRTKEPRVGSTPYLKEDLSRMLDQIIIVEGGETSNEAEVVMNDAATYDISSTTPSKIRYRIINSPPPTTTTATNKEFANRSNNHSPVIIAAPGSAPAQFNPPYFATPHNAEDRNLKDSTRNVPKSPSKKIIPNRLPHGTSVLSLLNVLGNGGGIPASFHANEDDVQDFNSSLNTMGSTSPHSFSSSLLEPQWRDRSNTWPLQRPAPFNNSNADHPDPETSGDVQLESGQSALNNNYKNANSGANGYNDHYYYVGGGGDNGSLISCRTTNSAAASARYEISAAESPNYYYNYHNRNTGCQLKLPPHLDPKHAATISPSRSPLISHRFSPHQTVIKEEFEKDDDFSQQTQQQPQHDRYINIKGYNRPPRNNQRKNGPQGLPVQPLPLLSLEDVLQMEQQPLYHHHNPPPPPPYDDLNWPTFLGLSSANSSSTNHGKFRRKLGGDPTTTASVISEQLNTVEPGPPFSNPLGENVTLDSLLSSGGVASVGDGNDIARGKGNMNFLNEKYHQDQEQLPFPKNVSTSSRFDLSQYHPYHRIYQEKERDPSPVNHPSHYYRQSHSNPKHDLQSLSTATSYMKNHGQASSLPIVRATEMDEARVSVVKLPHVITIPPSHLPILNTPSHQIPKEFLALCDEDFTKNSGNSENGGTSASSRRNAWGNLSYADLITKAILTSPDKRLTLAQIYDWMVQYVPYFKDKGDNTSSAGWKNSIRHNLSLHNRFIRIQNEGTGKSSWWMINPEARVAKPVRRRAATMDNATAALKTASLKRNRIRKRTNTNTAHNPKIQQIKPSELPDKNKSTAYENNIRGQQQQPSNQTAHPLKMDFLQTANTINGCSSSPSVIKIPSFFATQYKLNRLVPSSTGGFENNQQDHHSPLTKRNLLEPDYHSRQQQHQQLTNYGYDNNNINNLTSSKQQPFTGAMIIDSENQHQHLNVLPTQYQQNNENNLYVPNGGTPLADDNPNYSGHDNSQQQHALASAYVDSSNFGMFTAADPNNAFQNRSASINFPTRESYFKYNSTSPGSTYHPPVKMEFEEINQFADVSSNNAAYTPNNQNLSEYNGDGHREIPTTMPTCAEYVYPNGGTNYCWEYDATGSMAERDNFRDRATSCVAAIGSTYKRGKYERNTNNNNEITVNPSSTVMFGPTNLQQAGIEISGHHTNTISYRLLSGNDREDARNIQQRHQGQQRGDQGPSTFTSSFHQYPFRQYQETEGESSTYLMRLDNDGSTQFGGYDNDSTITSGTNPGIIKRRPPFNNNHHHYHAAADSTLGSYSISSSHHHSPCHPENGGGAYCSSGVGAPNENVAADHDAPEMLKPSPPLPNFEGGEYSPRGRRDEQTRDTLSWNHHNQYQGDSMQVDSTQHTNSNETPPPPPKYSLLRETLNKPMKQLTNHLHHPFYLAPPAVDTSIPPMGLSNSLLEEYRQLDSSSNNNGDNINVALQLSQISSSAASCQDLRNCNSSGGGSGGGLTGAALTPEDVIIIENNNNNRCHREPNQFFSVTNSSVST